METKNADVGEVVAPMGAGVNSKAAVGLFLASFLQLFTISTLNFNSFSDLSLAFALNPSIIISCLIFAVVMGLLGGFLPAVRASRLNIVGALRGG